MDNGLKTTLGFASAILAGVAIGILFAPDKGSETRRRLKETGEDLLDKGKNLFRKASHKGEELLHEEVL